MAAMEAKTEADAKGGPSLEAVKKQIYHIKGPRWRARLHPGSKAIDIPDLYLHKANVAEDDISEATVKNGFSIPQVVGNETFSAHDMIFDRLKAKGVLSQIGSLFHEVAIRREEICNHRNAAAPLQSRPPQRVTLNEVKLAAYIKELADPNVPLKKLARSVPHGYRGERMLDMLWNGGNLTQAMAAIKAQSSPSSAGTSTASPSVTIERAIWFVRVVGSSEITSSRARQGNSHTYTSEWTVVVMLWLRRQIIELNVIHPKSATPTTPSSPAAAVNRNTSAAAPKSTFTSASQQDGHYSLLLEDDFRSRWVAKWHYSLMLLRGLCHEHLVDPQAVLKAALDMLRTANLAQVSFAVALVQEFLEIAYYSAALADNSMNVCLAKLADLKSTLEQGRFGKGICKELDSMILSIALRVPDALINPSRWRRHGDIINQLLQASVSKEDLALIIHRNEKLVCALLDRQYLDLPILEQQTNVAILDRIAIDFTVEDAFKELFGSGRQSSSSSEKLRSILVWSTTTWRSGSHRPFAGARLLSLFSQPKDFRHKRHSKGEISLQKIDLGTFLLKWISEVEAAIQHSEEGHVLSGSAMGAIQSVDVASLIILIGEAIRLGTFSYPKYLQRLTARGLTYAQSRDEKSSSSEILHAKVMRSVPLASASVSLEHQRRLAIYGNRTKESWEEAMQRRASKEAANAFPWSTSSGPIDWNAEEPLRHFWSSSRFVQSRVIQSKVMTYFRQSSNIQPLTPLCLIQLSLLLANAEDFASLCELLITIYNRRQQVDPSLIAVCKDIATEHRVVWNSMGVPLLQQFGISPSTSYNTERRVSQHLSVDVDFKKRLQESARSYLQGGHAQASLLLQEVASQEKSAIGLLACSALFASATVLQETTGAEGSALAMVSWLRLVPVAFGTMWDGNWQNALVDALWSDYTVEEGTDKALFHILLRLLQCDLLSARDLLRQYIAPRMEQCAGGSIAPPSLRLAIDLTRALLINQVDADDPVLLARLRSLRSTLIVPDTVKEVISIVASLALLEGHKSISDTSSVRQLICREPLIQIHLQADFLELCSYLEERLGGDILSQTVADLLPTQKTLLLEDALNIDYRSIIADSSSWLSQQRLFELSVLVHRLDSVESGQQHRGQSKIETIASLSVERWFGTRSTQQDGLKLVTRSRSASFAKAVIEELLKRIIRALEQGAQSEVMETIECAIRLIETNKLYKLPSGTVSSSLLSSIGEWLATSKDSWDAELEDMADREEGLGQRLAVICLLLRFDNIWSITSKATALQLIFALLTQAVILSCQGHTRDAVVHQILDVTAYCLQEMPSDDRQAIQSMADTVAVLVQQAMPEDSVANRILFLFGRSPSSPMSGSPLVLANSAFSAFVSGRFTPVKEKPWELHNNVEALDFYSQHDQRHQNGDIDTTYTPLVNNGPISLELFSAKKTRDRLPSTDVQVDSEVSYGLGWGGEPIFARDLRRGLLSLEKDEVVHRQEKEKPEEPITEKKTSKKRSEPATLHTATAAETAPPPKKKAKKR